jgi:phosphate transport system substrate-binding protein
MNLRSLVQVILCSGLAAGVGCSGGGSQASRIGAGGATFVDPIMQKWAAEYKKDKGVEVDYVKSGSGKGITDLTAKQVAFGCSDAPMTKKELDAATEKGGDVFHIPVTMGAVAIVYNAPGVPALKLSGPVLADIYLGNVKTWNDPKISELNPGVALPDKAITPVQRAEDSGTTSIFSDYLSKVSPEFKEKVGAGKKMNALKEITGQKGNDGVASFVKNNPGSIGYVEVAYAKQNEIPAAALKNKSGAFVTPDAAGVTAAGEAGMKEKPTAEPFSLHDLTYSLTDAPGEASYPIVGMSYAILFKKQPKDVGPALTEFLKWVVTDGQKFASELHYAPLPEDLRKRATEKLGQVTFE